MSNLTSIIRGTKEKYLAQSTIDSNALYALANMPEYSISNADMSLAVTTEQDLYEVGEIFICSDSGNYLKGHIYQVKVTNGVKSWEDITPASGGSKDYQIVTDEPTDKSEGKMIYQKSAATTFGKAVINKTAGEGFYSSPSDFFSKFSEGTATISDIENYEYILSSSDGFVSGYINMGNLPELTQYVASSNSFSLLFKVNGGEEQTDTLTLDTETGFYVGTKLTVLRTNKLDETITIGVPDDYYTATIQDSESFPVATTDTIEVTRLNLGGTYVIVEKESSSSFDITNLKIANGSQYNTLKQLINDGMQEKLTAGTGITIENDMISASVQPLYKHELVIPYSFSVGDSETVNGSVTYHYLSNNGTQITSASAIDDNFVLSGEIGKNSANTVLLLNVNVTKAGNSITVEAVNAATMGYITGTVGTITDIVTQLN